MIRVLLSKMRQEMHASKMISHVRRNNPGAIISSRAIFLGWPGRLTIGEGTEIDDGAVLDFRYGGSITLSREVKIYGGTRLIPWGGNITLGDNCGVNHYSVLYGHGGLTVGKLTRFAAHCLVIPANHGFADRDTPIHRQRETKKGIVLGEDVWIGGNSTILDGVTVGQGSVIGAGSVVTKDIPPYSIAAGVPATVKRSR